MICHAINQISLALIIFLSAGRMGFKGVAFNRNYAMVTVTVTVTVVTVSFRASGALGCFLLFARRFVSRYQSNNDLFDGCLACCSFV
jgi:hypothetical protein